MAIVDHDDDGLHARSSLVFAGIGDFRIKYADGVALPVFSGGQTFDVIVDSQTSSHLNDARPSADAD
ncbi:hypothetical protein [Dyella silvatica]|uniref:hypothetical protein n=1 Tax=Dyella silvatica TaxID=2992128 RepID=UPI00225B7CD0|nr:hypothetical protein [Dyella silvatica]